MMRGWFFARPAGWNCIEEEKGKGKEIVGERFLSFKMNMYVYSSCAVLGIAAGNNIRC